MRLYDKKQIDVENILFDNKALFWLILPVIIEQLLNSLMGLAETMMVSAIGSESISAAATKRKAARRRDRLCLQCL